jgi:hypothetical protein
VSLLRQSVTPTVGAAGSNTRACGIQVFHTLQIRLLHPGQSPRVPFVARGMSLLETSGGFLELVSVRFSRWRKEYEVVSFNLFLARIEADLSDVGCHMLWNANHQGQTQAE